VPGGRWTGLIVGGIVALAVGVSLAACSSGTASTAPTTAPATITFTAAATPVATDPPAFSGPLQSLVIPKPPGAVYAPDKRKGDKDGVLTKQDVASEYPGDAATQVSNILTQDEFQRGVFLAWTDTGTLVYVQIYQFRYDREAASWNATMQSSAQAQGDATSTAVFDEIPSGRWFVTKTSDGRGAAHAFYSKGPFAVEIDTFKTGAADLDGTKKMAVDQYKLLP